MTQKIDPSDIVMWFLIIIMFLFIFTFGIYRFYIEQENVYLLNDYLKNEVRK